MPIDPIGCAGGDPATVEADAWLPLPAALDPAAPADPPKSALNISRGGDVRRERERERAEREREREI